MLEVKSKFLGTELIRQPFPVDAITKRISALDQIPFQWNLEELNDLGTSSSLLDSFAMDQ